MAALTSPQSADIQSYVDYSKVIQRERVLLDEKETIDKKMRWLYQAITHLCFNSTIPSTDPQIVTVTNQLREMKDWHSDIVSLKNNYTHQFLFDMNLSKELENMRTKLKKGFTRTDEPFFRCQERALESFNVYPEAYYSGTFVGKNVHKALKVNTTVFLST